MTSTVRIPTSRKELRAIEAEEALRSATSHTYGVHNLLEGFADTLQRAIERGELTPELATSLQSGLDYLVDQCGAPARVLQPARVAIDRLAGACDTAVPVCTVPGRPKPALPSQTLPARPGLAASRAADEFRAGLGLLCLGMVQLGVALLSLGRTNLKRRRA